MRIEKLNENKIRIFLSTDDLKEKNIDIHDFMSNSIESQDLFIDMLNMAETQVGFKTHNYKLIIEALASSEGNFIFTITRVKPDSSALDNNRIIKPKVKRQSIIPNKLLSIYKFKDFDDFCELCKYVNNLSANTFINKLKNSTLILFKNEYYLIIHNLKLSVNDLKTFSYTVSEFALSMKNEELLERKLKEYGKVIIAKNAISTCLTYFS